MMNWSEHETEAVVHRWPLILPLIAWLAAIGFVIVLAVLMSGCAAVEKPICAMRLIGQTQQADPVCRDALHH